MAKTHILQNRPNAFPYITDGFVLATDDPDQMGRVKIWCPAIDGDKYSIANLPWAEYATPFGGITTDFPTGREAKVSKGHVPYGFWSIPKLNAQVLVFFLNGDPNRRFYFASFFDVHRNRGLPGGRNKSDNAIPGPWTDTYEPLEPAATNLKVAFGDSLEAPQIQTRGAAERQVAQAQTEKDGKDGYAPSAADPTKYKDPQVYCWVTPGHHFITMSDNPDDCRVRVKTCEGNQIIMDDTNERIYMSTAKGKTWIELDEDGHINVYGAASVSIRAEHDINMAANRNINLEAQGGINIKSGGDTKISGGGLHLKSGGKLAVSGCTLDLISSNTKLSGGVVNIKSDGVLALAGSRITAKTSTKPTDADKDQLILPGGDAAKASCASEATSPSVIPAHEPWTRPVNNKRNPHFKG